MTDSKISIKKIILILITYSFCICSIVKGNEHLYYGIPNDNGQLLYREGYALLYDNIKKVPLWVSYHLTRQYLESAQSEMGEFQPDPDLPAAQRAELSDYKNSGYNKGHVASARDMKRSNKTIMESYYLSNTLPQVPGLDRGLWKSLEKHVRDFVRKKREAWIITGPVFRKLNENSVEGSVKTIGINKVWVPTHFYKIIIYRDKAITDVFAFLIPNENVQGRLSAYMTTVDNIESLTGLDFLNRLSDKREKRIESRISEKIKFFINVN